MRLFISHAVVRATVQASPIPIIETSPSAWKKFCATRRADYVCKLGAFYADNSAPFPPQFIYLNQQLANYKKVAVLRHELIHAECFRAGCVCMSDEGIENGDCEVHAIQRAFLHHLTNAEYAPLLFSMEYAVRSLFSNNPKQIRASEQIIKMPIWDDCLDYAGTFFSDWIERHPQIVDRLASIASTQ